MSDIVIRNLNKSFGAKTVLSGLSCRFPEAETSAVTAPSGAGKTTLLRILMGLERPDSGEIEGLDGKKISAVFQEDRLCENLSAAANIRLASPALSRERAVDALNDLGLGESANSRVRTLSGGMKRRVAILRALMCQWDVLILDEPFKGLDDELKARTVEYVRRLASGKTVILVTHDSGEIAMMGCKSENIVRL